MKKNFTLKWLVALLLILVFSLVTDNITSNLAPSTKRGSNAERAIQFCPAYPGLIKAKNPDGTSISFYLKGDEVLHWQVTPDGYTLLENGKGYYCYATQDAQGNLIPSSVVATDAKTKAGLSIPKNLKFSKSQISEALKTRDELFHPIASVKTTGSKTKGFTMGTRKVLVLLIDFKDRPFAHSRQEYDDLMNLPGYNGTGSFKDYYKAVSYNQLICETTVKGPYHANGTMAKYGSNINGNKYINAKLLVQEAVDAAELDGVNFADYDNDGDGYVDAVIVVHSNNDEAQGAGSNALWSHQSALRYGGMQRNYDGVTIDVYNIDPGVTGATGDAMGTIGVFCHEFGHALGLPDTYDIDYSGALTPANWDVMDNGSYNNGSRTPAYHNPWARTKLGWQTPVVKSNPETGLTLADCSTSKDLFRVNTQTKGEYYILENRQQTGYNQYVYGHGMLVWRIDSTYISTAGNGVNTDPAHQGVALVRANGVASNSGANPFPGTANILSFTDETTPSMKAYDGRRVYKPISNIQENTGTISFDFVQNLPATDVGVVAVTEPKSSLVNASSVSVKAKIKNYGSAAVSNFPISYTLDAETPVSETYTGTLDPGAIVEYTFATTLTLSAGDHSIKVSTAATGDAIAENDNATKPVSIFSSTVSFPFSEDFEGVTFPPTSWKVINPDVAAGTWVEKTSIGINGTSTKSAFIDYWNYGGSTDQLLTPPIELAGSIDPVLTFNYAYHKTNSDGLAIQISTDFGETYTTVWQKFGVDLATVPSTSLYNDFTPQAGDEWKTVNIEISQYIGKQIIISFTGISANGDNIYIDDVKVAESTCVAPTLAKNFTVTNLTKNSSTIGWDRGNGASVVVLQRIGQSVDGVPQNGTLYNVGDMIGGSKVIYVGDASSQNLVGLNPTSDYNFAVYEMSNTICYSSEPLTGEFTTLGLASVSTMTVRNIQPTSATFIGNVTSIGEAPVTERGICYNTDYSSLTTDFTHVVCQSGAGEFAATVTDLSPATYYYVVAYAKNMYGTSYGNVISFYTIGGCDVFNYSALGASTLVGTYTDLGSNGNAITVANNDDANSDPIDIGFSFKFNCLTFDKFILNTNGLIKLGTANPSTAGLFVTSPQTQSESGFFSKDGRDIFLIAPFNYDLEAGSGTPEYRIYTSGTAPNRVATIQFKNLRDKNKGSYPNQFTNIEFQIRLYETTNTIEFVYGTWTPSANAAAFRYGMVGIKGGGYGSDNLVSIYKSSTTAWSAAAFYSADYTRTFAFRRDYNVTSGRTYRFTCPYLTSDAAVKEVYALSNVPNTSGMPQTVSAHIANTGSSVLTNVVVTLVVTGNNTYSSAPITIPSIDPTKFVVVSFPAFETPVVGTNTITVNITSSDDDAANNSKAVTQTVSSDTYSYAVGSTPTSAYSTAYIVANKYHINGTRQVNSVDAFIFNTASNSGKSIKAYVLDANGTIIGQSNSTAVTLGAWTTFTIVTPPAITNSDFYVGIDATSVGGSFMAAYQTENPLRDNAYFRIPVAGGAPAPFGNNARLMIRTTVGSLVAVSSPSVTTLSFTEPSDVSASINGQITNDGGGAITERGFYWGTHAGITNADTKVVDAGTTVGNFSAVISGLTSGVTYYYVAYAKNSNGETLGGEISFTKKLSQTITFNSLTAMTYEDVDVALTATTSSSLPVSYSSSNTNVATIVETPASSGNFFIHIVGAGTCNIKASQVGDGSYGAATDVTQSLLINKKTVTVTIPDLARTFDYNPQVVVPTPALYSYVITYNGSSYAPVDVASYTVVATINDANYTGTATETLVIDKANSSITFNPIPVKKTGDDDFFPDVMSSSGLDIALASDNTSVVTIVSGNIHIVGAGTATITASSAGNGNFNAPASQDQTITVKASQVITLDASAKKYGDTDFAPGTVNSSLELTYQSSNSSVATIVSGKVHVVGVGSSIITASQAGDNSWAAAEKSYILVVNKGDQTITMDDMTKTYGDADFMPATVNSGLTITYSSDNLSVATIVSGTVHIVGAGTANISAEQSGNENYNAAVSVIKLLTVEKGTATIDITNITQTYDGTAKPVTTATTPVGLTVDVTYDGSATAPTNTGIYAVVATINDANYQGTANATLTISKADATIDITNTSFTYDGTAKSVTTATTPAGLTVDVTYDGSATAPTNAGTYAVVATINDANYQGTANATLTISKAAATIDITNTSFTYDGTAKSVTTATTPVGLTVDVTYDGSATAPTNASTYAVVATINDANYQGTANATLTISKAAATIDITNTSFTYDGTAKSVTTATTPVGLTVDVTYDGSTTAPTNAGTYAVVATINDANYQGTQNGTLTISKAAATIEITNTSFTYDGTAKSVTTTTTPVGLTVDVTYDGSATAPTNAGTYAVVATINDANYTGTQNGTLTIDKATATIDITNITQTYDGTAKTVTVTTIPANLNYTVTYDGSATAPTNTGNYAVVVTVNEPNYQGTQNATLQITPGTGVDPNDLNSIRIYSNATDIFVEIPVLEGTAQLGIYNILGKQVYLTVNLIQGLNKIEGNFISGTYIIRVTAGKKVRTQKILLK